MTLTCSDPKCGPCSFLRARDDMGEDLWTGTSFADATEAAIHMALIKFTIAVQDRDLEIEHKDDRTTYPSHHDIYQHTRRLVRDLAEGRIDPERYLAAYEEDECRA